MFKRLMVPMLISLLLLGATHNSGSETAIRSCSNIPTEVDRIYLKYTLPNIDGAFTSAVLYFNVITPYISACSVNFYTSTNTAWDNSSDWTTMSGISLGTSVLATTIAASSGWQNFTLTGDASKGIQKIYTDLGNNPGDCTIIITYAAPSGPTLGNAFVIGDTITATQKAIETGTSYLVITYTGAPHKPNSVVVGGIAY